MRRRTLLSLVALLIVVAAGAVAIRPRLAQLSSALPPQHTHVKYQCPMHPQIVSDEPGVCPICQMKLEPVGDDGLAIAADATPVSGERKPLFYRHPMLPDVISMVPAKDQMGMDYIPVYSEETVPAGNVPGHAGFVLSSERQQLIGVTHAPVERRRLESQIRAAGKVAYDPELYQAIMEYREALDTKQKLRDSDLSEAHAGADAIARSSALRLRQMGISESQLQEIAEDGRSPVNLLLPDKTVWVYAQVYEYEMDLVQSGQTVTITSPSQPGRTYDGRVVAVDPILNTATRTARVRIRVSTPDASLRPETFVNAVIRIPSGEQLAVPADAVVHTGEQEIVFVINSGGAFEPRAVQLGRQADRYYEVLAGLAAGEEVVTSANFLIDSESRFRAALAKFSNKSAAASDR